MKHLKSLAFCVLITIYHSSIVFGAHPDELSEKEIREKYTPSTKKEDRIDDGNNSVVIFGTKNKEKGNNTVIHVAIKVEKPPLVFQNTTFNVKDPLSNDIDVHRQLNKRYTNCLERHLSQMFFCGTYEKRPAIILARFGKSFYKYQKEKNFEPLSHKDFRRLANHLLTAVEAFHGAGYIHRDIHFKNVVFGFEDEPPAGKMRLKDATYKSDFYLIDFGSAVKHEENGKPIAYKNLKGSRRRDMLSVGLVLLNGFVFTIPDHPYYVPYPNGAAIADYLSEFGHVKDTNILKDVENYFNTLDEDLYGGADIDSEENYCKKPSYEKYRKIFA